MHEWQANVISHVEGEIAARVSEANAAAMNDLVAERQRAQAYRAVLLQIAEANHISEVTQDDLDAVRAVLNA